MLIFATGFKSPIIKRKASPTTIDKPDLPEITRLTPSSVNRLEAGELYEETVFQGQDWANQALSTVAFESVFLRSVNLSKTRLRSVRLRDVSVDNCDASLADWGGGQLKRVEVSASKWSGFNAAESRCEHVAFRDSRLSYAVFQFATLEYCRFENCDLSGASFEGSKLNHVTFRNCNLTDTLFAETRMTMVDLRGSNLSGLRIDLSRLGNVTVDPTQTEMIALLTGVTILEVDAD